MKALKIVGLMAAGFLTACGPGMEVTTPSHDGVTVERTANDTVKVTLDVEGWRLREAGQCGSDPECGHLTVLLSEEEQTGTHSWTGSACGAELDTVETSFEVSLAECTRRTGAFSVSVNLHDDHHVNRSGHGMTAFRRFVVEE